MTLVVDTEHQELC
ncbi:hypothetical protein D039_1024A, partial [Vibrio parahaemolyticus EKP-028]